MLQLPGPTVTALLCVAGLAVYRILQIGSREKYLPPGPPTVPILGNINIFPKVLAYYQFARWASEYGDIYSLKMGSGTVIVLQSAQAVLEVKDRQSGATADRPPSHFLDIIHQGNNLTFSHYGDTWRVMRKAAHSILTAKASIAHQPIQDAESTQLMYELLTAPKDFYDSIRRFSSSVILAVTYGKRAPRLSTKEVVDFFEMHPDYERLLFPGSYAPVDFIPILKYVPARFAPWKADCAKVKKIQHDVYFGLLEEVEERFKAGKDGNGCFMETVLKKADEWGFTRGMVGGLGGTLIEAGTDTTSSFTQTLVLALVAFPEVQKKAQAELDRVVGNERAPRYEDLDELPYIKAIVLEVHRWRPNAPIIPHAATADVTYRGYTIPAGATIFTNLYGMFHDPEVYDDPERFNPDRFLQSEFGTKKEREKDPGRRNNFGFGSGRRICAGIIVGEYSTHVNAMNLLWGFDFAPVKDANGKDLVPDTFDYAQALASFPNPFECQITPRSPEHALIIRKQFMDYTPLFQAYEREISPEDLAFVEDLRAKEKKIIAEMS
ncbi:cytochrome P450 [Mycena polygramma]|nr:cytochrome P450 [Mycena polygramma]